MSDPYTHDNPRALTREDQSRDAALWGDLVARIYGDDPVKRAVAIQASAMLTLSAFKRGELAHMDAPREPSPYIADPEAAEAQWRKRVSAVEGHNAGCLMALMGATLELQRGDDPRPARELAYYLAGRHGIEAVPQNAHERSRLATKLAHTGLLTVKTREER